MLIVTLNILALIAISVVFIAAVWSMTQRFSDLCERTIQHLGQLDEQTQELAKQKEPRPLTHALALPDQTFVSRLVGDDAHFIFGSQLHNTTTVPLAIMVEELSIMTPHQFAERMSGYGLAERLRRPAFLQPLCSKPLESYDTIAIPMEAIRGKYHGVEKVVFFMTVIVAYADTYGGPRRRYTAKLEMSYQAEHGPNGMVNRVLSENDEPYEMVEITSEAPNRKPTADDIIAALKRPVHDVGFYDSDAS